MQASQLRANAVRRASSRPVQGSGCLLRQHATFHKMHMPRLAASEVDSECNGVTSVADDTESNYSNFDALSELVKFVHESDIESLEMKHSGFTISMKKKSALQVAQPQVVHAPAAVIAAPVAAAPAPAPAAAAPPPPPAPKPAASPKVEGVEMISPMAGTFYRTPAPGEPLFVKEGDRVTKGQTIGIIEAMKLMNEIEAEMSGEVIKFLVDNGSAISPGQPLVVIKP